MRKFFIIIMRKFFIIIMRKFFIIIMRKFFIRQKTWISWFNRESKMHRLINPSVDLYSFQIE